MGEVSDFSSKANPVVRQLSAQIRALVDATMTKNISYAEVIGVLEINKQCVIYELIRIAAQEEDSE